MNSTGDVVDERLLIRYMYIHIFYGASALFCTPSRRLRDDADVGRRRANDRFAIFWGKCFERWQSEIQQSLRRRHDEGPKGTRGNGMGACIRRGFPLCPRCMYTHNTHVIRVHLFFIEHPTPNTQKKQGRKKRENMYISIHLPCARACTKPGFAHARVCAHTGSTRRRRFLRRVVRERRYGSIRLFSRAVVVGCVGCVPRSSARK